MIDQIQARIEPLRQQLLSHNVYKHIDSIEDLQHFMQYHVFAVWDFMSLVKSLQNHLTCVNVPWVPKGSPLTRRLINEIVFGEESDVDALGNPASHYELYIEAMDAIGADIETIETLLQAIIEGQSPKQAMLDMNLAPEIQQFVNFTFEVIQTQKPHIIAAVFTFGREDLIPDMFTSILKDLQTHYPEELGALLYYFERHIEVDGGEHGPMALQMIEELCYEDDDKWHEAMEYAYKALESRLILWNGILNTVQPA